MSAGKRQRLSKKVPPEVALPFFRFCQHRDNANRRGIEFKITFDEWWKIWSDSGHWDQRGHGADRYCMCRVGDEGHYQVGNVFIATNSENLIAQRHPNKKLPMGVRQQALGTFYASRMINRVQYYLGTFDSAEKASDAYQNFTA